MPTSDHQSRAPVGVILAGGQGRRLGGTDKVLCRLGGRTVLSRLIEVLAPQCHALLLNANGDAARFGQHGLPMIPDAPGDAGSGPLAGVLAGMEAVAARWPERALLTVAGDAPFLPPDLVRRLMDAKREHGAEIVTAASGLRVHPVIALWDTGLRLRLQQMLHDGCSKVGAAQARFRVAQVTWASDHGDPFLNINTASDLAEAEQRAQAET